MKDSGAIRSEATEWFLLIQSTKDPSPEVLQKWLSWLDASEENRRAFEELAQLWHGVTPAIIARPAAEPSQDDYDGSVPIAEWRACKDADAHARANAVRHRGWRRSLITTAVAATIGAAAWFAQDHFRVFIGPAPVSAGTFATRTGEHMDLLLADGSRVTLGGHSQVVIDFTPTEREVRLGAGEAFFSVEKDPERRFTVLALDGAITAVGTAFNVRAVEDRVTVTVTEGTVRVKEIVPATDSTSAGSTEQRVPDDQEAASDVHVARGQQLTYRPDAASQSLEVTPIRHVNADESARWREGWLVYRDEPLRYVIADIRRYTDLDLAVADSAADLRFSGAVFRDRVAEWIVALPEVSPVMIETHGDHLTIKTRPAGIIVQH